MNDVVERISDLQHIQEVSNRNGMVRIERWAQAEIAEMKVVLKRNEKALAGTRA